MKDLCIKILFGTIGFVMLVLGLFGFLAFDGRTQDYALMTIVGGVFGLFFIFSDRDDDGEQI